MPRLFALSSPAVSAVSFHENFVIIINPTTEIIALTHTLAHDDLERLPKDQFDIICATSAEAVYCKYCCNAVKKKFIIIPISIRTLVSSPLDFPNINIAVDTAIANKNAIDAVPIH